MKLNFKAILYAAATVFMTVSCEDGILDRSPNLGDVVADPVELTDVLFSDGERVKPYYQYSVKLGTAGATETSGVILDVKFVSNEPTLHAATFAPAAAGNEHRNTYLTGANGTTLTVNGEVLPVTKGDIKLGLADGKYTLSGVVAANRALEDGKTETLYYDLSWAGGVLEFGALPVKTDLTHLLAAQNNAMMGVKTVTVKMSTSSEVYSEFDWTTFTDKWYGNGNFLAVDFYSENGYLAAGTYKASADPSAPKAGEFVIGYDFAEYNMANIGTCWWTVKDGAATAEKITAGEIIVEMTADKVYTISIDNGQYYAVYTGKIPALTEPEKPQGGEDSGEGSGVVELPVLLYANPNPDYAQVVLSVASEGVSATQDATGATTYSGTGKVLNLTIHSDGNVIPTGKYDAAADTNNPNTWQTTVEFFGMKFGSTLVDVVNGTASVIDLTEGTVWVGAKEGKYIINAEVNGYKFRYTGSLGDKVTAPADDDGGYVGDDADTFDGVELTGFGGKTDYTGWGMQMIGLDLYSDGCTVESANWQYTYTGEGHYLKLEIYSADGSVAPGVYEVSSELAEGKVNAGNDMGGTEWFQVADGAATSLGKVTDGTVTVEQDGDTYTIIIESTTCKARYVGTLTK